MQSLVKSWQSIRSGRPLPAQLSCSFWWGQNSSKSGPPPAAPCPPLQPVQRSVLGKTWTDEYSYLEASGPSLTQHLQAEQAYFVASMREAAQLQRELHGEMMASCADAVVSAPERIGQYEYFTLATAEKPHVCYMRRCMRTGAELPVLDTNEGGHRGAAVSQLKMSKSQRLVAYTLDDGEGSEVYRALVKNVEQGQILDEVPNVMSIELGANDETLLYTVADSTGRPCKVMLHRIGAPLHEDVCVLEEPDPQCFLEIGRTKDWAFLTLNANSKTSSEVHLMRAERPGDAGLACVEPRRPGLEYFVEHHSGRLYILTNAASEEYALMTADVRQPQQRHWRRVLPERPGVTTEDLDVFSSALVLYERHAGMPAVSILPISAGEPLVEQLRTAALPKGAMELAPGANPDYHAVSLTVHASSPISAEAAWSIALQPPHAVTPAQAPAQSGSSGSLGAELVCTRTEAVAEDGTPVPITLAHRKGLRMDGSHPMLLTAYGAYGVCADAGFRLERRSLLQRGWVLAIAHVRGGGELGRRWHTAAVGPDKARSVGDLEACLEHLIATGHCSEGRVALEATSAGALTAAALLNRSPGSFAAALLRMPFVDVLSAMTNPKLALTAHERDEWGDPASDDAALDALLRLCPYQNIRRGGAYPPVLLTCAGNDARVPAWGPAKFAARLRAARADSAPVLLVYDEGGGHFGADERSLERAAREYAFLLYALEGGWSGLTEQSM